ncbi:NAD(P)/FAD-dependent oxidoreductase [Rubellicoccus peritrichatus]|uniref:Tryptophan 7-halogenase n=1 Tax=Rubellicoccus peritrichatus TaxID=3080537 RepID=A0AAQ3QW60_9BACT|nr:tryptophan 7-halogenase [Puniceicoccus sp. CR14]WOO42318.1 tryptophan 7-halogenase [Puniceicoccus sp. CR14]
MSTNYDCIILGGGPAGSAAGALLAQGGMSVCIIEKETFPRFHIGESLLPAGNETLRRMGVWESIEQTDFITKQGAEFTYGSGDNCVHIAFRDGLIDGLDSTRQVRRAEFDQILLEKARGSGCDLCQPARVTAAEQTDQGWNIKLSQGSETEQLNATWFLDAGGRGRFLGSRLKLLTTDVPLPKRFAVFSRFRGVKRREGDRAGNIIVIRILDGWFWSIPVSESETSVGLVCTRKYLNGGNQEEIFYEAVSSNPFMKNWMADAKSVEPFRTESDYSYIHERFAGERWFLLGDAAGFIDPVFSSGVYLALKSAEAAADSILAARDRGVLSKAEQTAFTQNARASMKTMEQLVCSFYHPKDFSVFMHPRNVFSVVSAINSIVAGRSDLNFQLWWRFLFFRTLCRINRLVPLAPRLQLD